MVHELSHQSFRRQRHTRVWSDLWLNEGHATWYEALYAEEKADKPMETRMKAAYRASDSWRAAGGPPAAPKEPAAGTEDQHLPAERLRRGRARPVRAAPGDRTPRLRAPGAHLGRPPSGRLGDHRGLRAARVRPREP